MMNPTDLPPRHASEQGRASARKEVIPAFRALLLAPLGMVGVLLAIGAWLLAAAAAKLLSVVVRGDHRAAAHRPSAESGPWRADRNSNVVPIDHGRRPATGGGGESAGNGEEITGCPSTSLGTNGEGGDAA
jgi:hypothetical protein